MPTFLLDEVERLLEELNLTSEIYSLRAFYLEYCRAARVGTLTVAELA